MAKKQTYLYIKEKSIIYGVCDDYNLTLDEYYKLYSFFVTYSLCGSQSWKKRSFSDYGWETENISERLNGHTVDTPLGSCLKSVFLFDNNFSFSETDNLDELFRKQNLEDGPITNVNVERAVIGKTPENNKYTKFFYRIRDGLAHGKFVLKYSSSDEKMIVIQDDNSHSITARIVVKLSTLLDIINNIDLTNLI